MTRFPVVPHLNIEIPAGTRPGQTGLYILTEEQHAAVREALMIADSMVSAVNDAVEAGWQGAGDIESCSVALGEALIPVVGPKA